LTSFSKDAGQFPLAGAYSLSTVIYSSLRKEVYALCSASYANTRRLFCPSGTKLMRRKPFFLGIFDLKTCVFKGKHKSKPEFSKGGAVYPFVYPNKGVKTINPINPLNEKRKPLK